MYFVLGGRALLVLHSCFLYPRHFHVVPHCNCFPDVVVLGVIGRALQFPPWPVCCAPFFWRFWGPFSMCLVLAGLALGTSFMRFVGAVWFESASSSTRHFIFPCIICPAFPCSFTNRLCLSGIRVPCMLVHISSIFALSGFRGHVHVGHVYGFSRIHICIIKWVRLEYFPK